MDNELDLPKEMSFLIMEAVLRLIKDDLEGLERDDPTRLRLVEIRPRAEEFADMLLSCSIAPNDPENPGQWVDEEIVKWPPKQSPFTPDAGRNFNEIGGGQGWQLKFTLFFTLFYNEMGIKREQAVAAARVIMARIRMAIVQDWQRGGRLGRLRDDFGGKMVSANKAVKRMESTPAGSEEETFLKCKMWLSFGVYFE